MEGGCAYVRTHWVTDTILEFLKKRNDSVETILRMHSRK